MADTKITALAAIATVDPAADVLPIVDISDTSMAASGTTKKITSNQILGSGGTATLASATITGAATVGTTLGVTGNLTVLSTGLIVNTTGVGVGVTPSNNLHVKGASGSTAIRLEAVTDGTLGFIGSASGLISGSPANNIALRAENGLYLSGNGNATQFILNSAGNVTVSNGNVIIGTSGKGIDFSAVTGGTGTATGNVLNDYEEGTFTPTLQFSGLSVGVTYSTRTGIYTKVGRIVHFSGRIDLSSKGTSVGDATIAGLPFAANTGAASVGYQSSIAPSDKQAILTIDTSSLIVRYASGTTTAASTDTNFSNSSILIFAGTYAV